MKRASFEKVVPSKDSSFKMFHFKTPYRIHNGRWHFHPEFEIVYLPSGKGKRFVGDSVSEYTHGDLVLLGPNIPHNCFNVGFESDYFEEYVIQFKGEDIQNACRYFKELGSVDTVLAQSGTGLCITTEEKHDIGKSIKKMMGLSPAERLLQLIRILQQFANIPYKSLEAKQYVKLSAIGISRVKEVYQIIQEQYHIAITTREVANEIGMTESSFCRFFVKSTGKTFKQALTEIRIQNACNLLANSDATISAIAYDCGFNSVSLFNRLFKRMMHDTPSMYREKYVNRLRLSSLRIT